MICASFLFKWQALQIKWNLYIVFIMRFYFNIFFSVYLTFQARSHKPAWNNFGDFDVSTSKWPFVMLLFCFVNLKGVNFKNQKIKLKEIAVNSSLSCFFMPFTYPIKRRKMSATKTRWHSNPRCCCFSSVHSKKSRSRAQAGTDLDTTWR